MGQHVRIAKDASGRHVAFKEHPEKAIGVIDPFLEFYVMRWERCWLLINPGTITSLRHDWTHSKIDEEVASG